MTNELHIPFAHYSEVQNVKVRMILFLTITLGYKWP